MQHHNCSCTGLFLMQHIFPINKDCHPLLEVCTPNCRVVDIRDVPLQAFNTYSTQTGCLIFTICLVLFVKNSASDSVGLKYSRDYSNLITGSSWSLAVYNKVLQKVFVMVVLRLRKTGPRHGGRVELCHCI